MWEVVGGGEGLAACNFWLRVICGLLWFTNESLIAWMRCFASPTFFVSNICIEEIFLDPPFARRGCCHRVCFFSLRRVSCFILLACHTAALAALGTFFVQGVLESFHPVLWKADVLCYAFVPAPQTPQGLRPCFLLHHPITHDCATNLRHYFSQVSGLAIPTFAPFPCNSLAHSRLHHRRQARSSIETINHGLSTITEIRAVDRFSNAAQVRPPASPSARWAPIWRAGGSVSGARRSSNNCCQAV